MAEAIDLTRDDWLAIEAEYCRRSLANFVRLSWPILEPSRELVWGWPLDAMCEHLEAVSRGELNRLLINVPPGCMKSLTTRVFWPTWEWLLNPGYRYIGASYADKLAIRDNRRAKLIVASEWYQSRFGGNGSLQLADDQAAKGRFENAARGWMQATSVEGLGAGERGDRFIIDDPHNTKQAESPARREATLQWFSETVPSRLNDLETSPIVVIMQRLHERDVSGHILEHDLGYEHLMLPMEFEPDRRCSTSIGFTDPRKKAGELLWPERFSRHAVETLKSEFRAWGGTYAEAGQLQQRPAPRTGGMFQADEFRVVDVPPSEAVETIRYWDKAGTEGGGAYTAGVKMSLLRDGSYLVEDVRRGQWSMGKRERVIRATAENDTDSVVIWMEQEPGSGGKDVAQLSIKQLAGFTARADKVSGKGSKDLRAQPYAAQVEVGNVYLMKGSWNSEFIEEHRSFPAGRYKDQVDAAAGAFNKLQKRTATPEVGIGGGKVTNWATI